MKPCWECARARLHRYRLPKPVGGSGIISVDIISVELSADGCTGLGFSYVLGAFGASAFSATRALLEEFVEGQPVLPAPALCRTLSAALFRQGRPASIGFAAIDVAAWDLQAKMAGLPLYAAMGGVARTVPVYGSGGFSSDQSVKDAITAAQRYAEAGFTAVKLRVGGSPHDRALIEGVARELPLLRIFVDANEKCDLPRALVLAARCAELGVEWIEEPLPSSSRDGYATLARGSRVALAGGEHLQGMGEVKLALDVGALAIVQPDLAMMGGLSECLRAAALAESYGRTVTPHFLPDLFAHLAGVAPNITMLEHFPLLEVLFADAHGADHAASIMRPCEGPGHGLAWSDRAPALLATLA